LIWLRKFQGSPAFRLWHGYFWLLLASFTVRIYKIRVERFENCTVWPEKEYLKIVDKESLVVKEIKIIKKKSKDWTIAVHAYNSRYL
jgi:hypothetical protein